MTRTSDWRRTSFSVVSALVLPRLACGTRRAKEHNSPSFIKKLSWRFIGDGVGGVANGAAATSASLEAEAFDTTAGGRKLVAGAHSDLGDRRHKACSGT